jgi:YesN/AraC family two-component response regulator
MAYFTNQKIVRAKHLIRSETVSFTELAEQLGFSSVNYFSKVFKEKVGVSPTEFSRYVSKRHVAKG